MVLSTYWLAICIVWKRAFCCISYADIGDSFVGLSAVAVAGGRFFGDTE